jgi:hypothetical protein
MASSQVFFQAASLHGLEPGFPDNCKSLWPQAKISSKLQLFMALDQNFLKAASVHGLKPRFPPSYNYSWPQAKISSKLQLFMASSHNFKNYNFSHIRVILVFSFLV